MSWAVAGRQCLDVFCTVSVRRLSFNACVVKRLHPSNSNPEYIINYIGEFQYIYEWWGWYGTYFWRLESNRRWASVIWEEQTTALLIIHWMSSSGIWSSLSLYNMNSVSFIIGSTKSASAVSHWFRGCSGAASFVWRWSQMMWSRWRSQIDLIIWLSSEDLRRCTSDQIRSDPTKY